MILLAWFALLVTQPVLPAPMGKLSLFPKHFTLAVMTLAQQVSNPCSIRLLEMQIPKDVQFSMNVIKPDAKAMSGIPQVKVPAPPCSK